MEKQGDYWRLLDENGPKEVDDILGRLYARLGGHARWLKALESNPEYAGLIAGLLDIDADGPDIFLDALNAVRGHEATATTLFQVGPRPEEAMATARLLKEEGTLIPRLIECSAKGELIGLLQPDALPRDAEARRIHRLWARGLLERGLSSPDERFDRIQSVLLMHAPTVAARLDKDLDFRQRFEQIARLAESVLLKESDDDLEWVNLVEEPALWECLQEYGAQGRDLREAYGPAAVFLLTTPEYRHVRQAVLGVVGVGDHQAMQALLDDDLRGRSSFMSLLRRRLPPAILATALANLQAAPQETPHLLAYYGSLSDAVLIEDLGPQSEGALGRVDKAETPWVV